MLFDESASRSTTFSWTTRRSVSVSTSSSNLSDATAATTMSFDSSESRPVLDKKFVERFAQIVRRWRQNEITEEDTEYLGCTPITDQEYLLVTEDFGLRHGVELVKHRICFVEYPSALHEFMSRKMDKWVDRCCGDNIVMLGSTSKGSSLFWTNVLALVYEAGHGKQADSSYIPRNLPPPSRHNQLKYRPNSQSPYPTFVFECADSNENRDRLLNDAEAKHFHINTSIEVWLGLKVCLSPVQGGETFWIGWGRRKNMGYGLKLEEQSEDEHGMASYLPVYGQDNVVLIGQLTIPTRLIFQPLQRPADVPLNLVISFENVRQAIIEGLEYM